MYRGRGERGAAEIARVFCELFLKHLCNCECFEKVNERGRWRMFIRRSSYLLKGESVFVIL